MTSKSKAYRRETSLPMRIRIRIRIWRGRAENRYRDMLARLAGYCNDPPWDIPGEGGGYAHWRCARPRGHEGLHRYINYVWTDDGRTDYLPTPLGQPSVKQPQERHMTLTRRQQRRLDNWHERERDGWQAVRAEEAASESRGG